MNNYTYSNELYHYGVLGMKWGVRKDRLSDKQFNKKIRKAQKYSRKMNKLSKSEQVYSNAAKSAQEKADNYRKLRNKRNIFIKAISSLDQYALDNTARSLGHNTRDIRKEMTRLMRKVGNDPYLNTKIYLKDVWGLPYDTYDITVSKDPRKKEKE